MDFKFSFDEFMAMLADYNDAIWPLQIIVYLVTVSILVMIFLQVRHSGKILTAWLGMLWIWVGIVFNLIYFSKVTQGGIVFGIIFVLQGMILLYSGFAGNDLSFRLNSGWKAMTGLIIMLYALIGYPALEYAWGRGYPEILPFGLAPCPLTVFTLGIVLLSVSKIPGYVVIIPVIYSFGGIIPVSLGIKEDIGLIISGLLVLILWIIQRNSRSTNQLS